ncbi:hypothetical protein GN316_15660 [Xylophilus sp. Kf1]|nr:hypothetical protein [Xylophilus sp. Kf1]
MPITVPSSAPRAAPLPQAQPPSGIAPADLDASSPTPVGAPHPLQAEMQALSPIGGAQAVSGDFGPRQENLDRRYATLAGVVPNIPVSVPASRAEQFARDTLDSTWDVINDLAMQLLQRDADIVTGGSGSRQVALAESIQRFLHQAESTMVELVARTVRDVIDAPPSPAMRKMLDLWTSGIWRGLENMQRTMVSAFGRPMAGAAPDTLPDAAQRARISQRFAAEYTREIKAKADAIGLPTAKRPGFDAGPLAAIAALQQELAAVTPVARSSQAGAAPSAAFLPKTPFSSDWAGLEATDQADEQDEFDAEDDFENGQDPQERPGN